MSDNLEVKIWISLILILLVSSVIFAAAYSVSETAVSITVDAKDIKYHCGDEKYLIHST